VVDAVRTVLEDVRHAFPASGLVPEEAVLLDRTGRLLEEWTLPTLRTVINATGVVLHTNLGRAPLSASAMRAAEQAGLEYSTLEYDLQRGKRGSRLLHAEALLQKITGAEAALVVNNNAAAVLIVLTALARRRAVVIPRSQLVEIGGGFRVPDVMKQSGARLLEVGATNRVHLSDFEEALEESPALFLRAHRSNFKITGFISEPSLEEMAQTAHRAGIPLVDDLGSGTLLDTARFGLEHEPMVQESLSAGADLVCFSGDKLLGGPQAGIIVGRAVLVDKLKKHPLARALRADKLCLAALSATLLHYLKGEAEREIPIWRMISTSPEAIRDRAAIWCGALHRGEVIPGRSTIGGGSLPGETLPTFLFALNLRGPNRFLERLRSLPYPIIARLEEDKVVFDPRTVLPGQDSALLDGIQKLLPAGKSAGIEAEN
jgi:L-seryl-tRNA(Ser) seleniumtransferase